METLKGYDAHFRSHNFTVVELVKENELTTEHAILDEHSDRVKHFTNRLQQLVPMLKNTLCRPLARSTCISKELLKLLHFIMMELTL